MLFKKVKARLALNKKNKNKNKNKKGQSTDQEPVFYEEPSISDESSEVEYMEDDDEESSEPKQLTRRTSQLKKTEYEPSARMVPNPPIHEMDELLSMSVVVPFREELSEAGSNSSNDRIFTKLPTHLGGPSTLYKATRIEQRKSMATSTTSEEVFTQTTASPSDHTVSETGTICTSDTSVRYDSKKQKQLEYWTEILETRMSSIPKEKCAIGESLMELGTMHMYCEQYESARDYFRRATSVFEDKFGRDDLRVAKALEKAGAVECSSYAGRRDQKSLDIALSFLDRAFRIRYEKLGSSHVDTVETLNKIARVLMSQKDFSGARDSYYEVLKMREAIFGSGHPCVAISAHMLATAHTRLFQVKAAQHYFQFALKVYEENGLGRHSFAETIRRDLHDLQFIRRKTRFEV